MNKAILSHYRQFGLFTNPGLYKDILKNKLPEDIRAIGQLIRQSIIHRLTLESGDATELPWYRQPEDDNLPTAAAMLAELYRRDERGIIADRKEEDRLVLTCRFVAILMASVLKCKGIPTRVRAGHASYFGNGKVSYDHWINQYWDSSRWVTIDVDGGTRFNFGFDPYDIPAGKFDFPAEAWLKARSGDTDPKKFATSYGHKGYIVLIWSIFFDFHSLMNQEITYTQISRFGTYAGFRKLTEAERVKIDGLARLMVEPDVNFKELKKLWETDRDFRLLKSWLM